jgi:hypothetical protein
MEIIAIEKQTFERMMQSFECFVNQVKTLCGNNRIEQWLNNREACELLKISPRTLQSYRDTGILPYSQIGHKCYYRIADVEKRINPKMSIRNNDVEEPRHFLMDTNRKSHP